MKNKEIVLFKQARKFWRKGEEPINTFFIDDGQHGVYVSVTKYAPDVIILETVVENENNSEHTRQLLDYTVRDFEAIRAGIEELENRWIDNFGKK